MLICILGVYLLAVWILFYKLKIATLDLKAKIVVFAIGLGIVASFFFMAQRFAPYTKDVYVQSFVVPMASQVSGRVTTVHVKENQSVSAGDPLFQIDTEPYELAVETLRAQLVEAKQTAFANYTALAAASETVRQADSQIQQAEDNITALLAALKTSMASQTQAEAQVELDEANVERTEKLIEGNAASKQELDTRRGEVKVSKAALLKANLDVRQAETALRVGQSQLNSAIAGREVAVAQVRQIQVRVQPQKTFEEMIDRRIERKADLEKLIQSSGDESNDERSAEKLTEMKEEVVELELHLGWLREHEASVVGLKEYLQGQLPRVKSLEAQLKRAQFDLKETTVLAPSKGYASNLQLTPGAFANAGSPLLSFVDSEQTWVVAIVTENGLGLVKPGDAVEITMALYPGKVLSGEVESVVWGVGQAQGVPSGTLPKVAKTERTQKYMVRLRLDDEASDLMLRQGSTAVAAIYTEHGRMLHIIRKVQIRIQSILNYLYV
ncbi:Inner membrane protein YiaV precursor [Planctomycetes bacterium CA13]|uniref:Inner membrane protein YiaV n=1 Tax=Novipirellula herctigrandis TaxID=2527986 RepID=A0A5C5Z2Y1_9BACT|nr:Inner membrane protein YiaV precursor [Planctomycetes bacterium CA13]